MSRKINWDEIARVFIQVKVWFKNSLSQLEGGGWGGACLIRGTGCGGQQPRVQACNTYVREKWPCAGVTKGSLGMVEIKLLCFRWLSPSFKPVQMGFPGFQE